MNSSTISHLEFRTEQTLQLCAKDLSQIHDFFEKNYSQANHAYLDLSLSKLDRIALAFENKQLVGFSLAGSTRMALPRIETRQAIMLGGIGCIDARFRRQGLFSHLASLAGGKPEQVFANVDRVLACARIAHPASFRTIKHLPGSLPKLGQPLSSWHLEIATVVASLYGVTLKSNSLVVQGCGTPIGYPNIEVEANEQEWLPFADVDRDRGDSLLAIAWAPTVPEGWQC